MPVVDILNPICTRQQRCASGYHYCSNLLDPVKGLSTHSSASMVVRIICIFLYCLSVSVKWLAVKTASEMTYTVSSGALNSTPTNQPSRAMRRFFLHVGWSDVTESSITIRSPFCGYNLAYCVELKGDDLWSYSHKIESFTQRKCPQDH